MGWPLLSSTIELEVLSAATLFTNLHAYIHSIHTHVVFVSYRYMEVLRRALTALSRQWVDRS